MPHTTHMEATMIEIRLREIAESRDLNISKVQMGASVSMGSIRRFWYDELTMIDIDVLDRLCEFLQVTPGDLIRYVPPTDT